MGFDFERPHELLGLLQAGFDLPEAVFEAPALNEYFADGDEVVIGFFRFKEMF